jgi:crossover junction endodeoxyribonuclease RuvC
MRVLGIDPGLRHTGFGVIEAFKGKTLYVTSGVIATKSDDTLPNRLKTILNGLSEIIETSKPNIACIEKVFVNVNPQSTLLLGQARGAAITACVLHDIDVAEYTALQIKKTVVGYGHAEKHQVAKMVQYLLNLNGEPSSDAADALAIALTYVFHTPDRLLV